MNLSGEAVGDAYYNPPGGFFIDDPLFLSVGNGITVAQPSCATYATGCAGNIGYGSISGFGGCEINDSGTVLGYGYEHLLTFPFSSPGSAKDSIKCGSSTVDCVSHAMINNANQVVYDELTVATGAFTTFFYSPATGKTTQIPFLPKSTCTQESPFSFSNIGVVIGYTADCPNVSDDIDFIWSQATGTSDLYALIPVSPKYSAINPMAINDAGRLLVNLVLPSGAVHWGILNPIVPTVHGSRIPVRP